MTRPIYIAIEGVIGVGKTTLARLLQREFDASLVLEVFEENPFLPLFYQEPERYAFQNQIVFLLSRYHQQRALASRVGHERLVSDYLFAKDRLFAQYNMAGEELEAYDKLHDALAERVAQPDLVIYLRAEVDTLMARITQRDRPYERAMAREYIAGLAQRYEHFFARYEATALLTVDTDDLNLLTNEADLQRIRERVRAALFEGLYQPRLPLGDTLAETQAPAASAPSVPSAPALAVPEALMALLAFQEESSTLAGALRRTVQGDSAALPGAIARMQQRLAALAEAAGVAGQLRP